VAGQGRVIVDVELEEVVERVIDGVDGAVELGLDAVAEFEGQPGLFARGEGDVLEVMLGVLNVFACFSISWT
jgi:hypothetical protein